MTAAMGVADGGPRTERERIVSALDRIGIVFKSRGLSLWVEVDGSNVTGYEARALELRFTKHGLLEHIGLWNESDVPGEEG